MQNLTGDGVRLQPLIYLLIRQDCEQSPTVVLQSAPAAVRQARAGSLAVRGAQLFNAMPVTLRNSDHGDVLMFKNHLDIYLQNVPDQPTSAGSARGALTNSLLQQVPMYESSY